MNVLYKKYKISIKQVLKMNNFAYKNRIKAVDFSMALM